MFEAINIERNKQLSARLPTQLKHLKMTNGKAIPLLSLEFVQLLISWPVI